MAAEHVTNRILTTDDISVFERELCDIDSNWLVVFDCDDVLTTVKEQFWKEQNREFFKKWCKNRFGEDYETTFFEIVDFVIVFCRNYIVSERMPAIVDHVYESNAKAVVVTAFTTRPVANVSDPLHWRAEMLKKFGYRFDRFWYELIPCVFHELGEDFHPKYESGVVCCEDISKADALESFLKYSKFFPKKIVFIDDRRDNLEFVSEFSKNNGIDFVGIEYHGAKNVMSDVPFSEKMVDFQLNTFLKKNIWVPDADAAEILDKRLNSSTRTE